MKAVLPLTEKESWRPGLLDCLVMERSGLEREGQNTKKCVAMIKKKNCAGLDSVSISSRIPFLSLRDFSRVLSISLLLYPFMM